MGGEGGGGRPGSRGRAGLPPAAVLCFACFGCSLRTAGVAAWAISCGICAFQLRTPSAQATSSLGWHNARGSKCTTCMSLSVVFLWQVRMSVKHNRAQTDHVPHDTWHASRAMTPRHASLPMAPRGSFLHALAHRHGLSCRPRTALGSQREAPWDMPHIVYACGCYDRGGRKGKGRPCGGIIPVAAVCTCGRKRKPCGIRGIAPSLLFASGSRSEFVRVSVTESVRNRLTRQGAPRG
jgi:hypothetical protein